MTKGRSPLSYFAALNPGLRQMVTSAGGRLRLHQLHGGAWRAVDVPVQRLRDRRVGRRFDPPEGVSQPAVESLARALAHTHGETAVIVAGGQTWRAADLRIRDAPPSESRRHGF